MMCAQRSPVEDATHAQIGQIGNDIALAKPAQTLRNLPLRSLPLRDLLPLPKQRRLQNPSHLSISPHRIPPKWPLDLTLQNHLPLLSN